MLANLSPRCIGKQIKFLSLLLISMAKIRKRRGFTLIELLIVIAIIGILASIVLVSLSSARKRARMDEFKSKVKSMQIAMVSGCEASPHVIPTWTDPNGVATITAVPTCTATTGEILGGVYTSTAVTGSTTCVGTLSQVGAVFSGDC